MKFSQILLGASAALMGGYEGPMGSDAFVIKLQTAAELEDAMDSYPSLVVQFESPNEAESRELLEEFKLASKSLVPKYQLASLDSTSDEFRDIVDSLGRPPFQVLQYRLGNTKK